MINPSIESQILRPLQYKWAVSPMDLLKRSIYRSMVSPHTLHSHSHTGYLLEHSNSGKKDSIRFANVINLPLLH